MFIFLSRKIIFTTANHITDRKAITIFKDLKEIYMQYINSNFIITTLHVDGKFLPIQELINEMPGRPWFNLASANEHVPNIER